MSELSDGELTIAWRGGNEAAGQDLFDRHYARLVRFFRTKVGDDYPDLVQRTFLAMVEAKGRLRDPTRFRQYLFAVAYNQLRRHYGATTRAVTREQLCSVSAAELGPSLSAVLGQKEDAKRLLIALRELPVDLQVAFELYCRENLTAAEIAKATDVPLGTVKTRLRQARLRLAEALSLPGVPVALVASADLDLDGWAKKVSQTLDS